MREKWDKFIFSVRLVYKNMFWGISKAKIITFVSLVLFSSFSTYASIFAILGDKYGILGPKIAAFFGLLGLIMWCVALPWIIFFIDLKKEPERIIRLAETIPEYYSIR